MTDRATVRPPNPESKIPIGESTDERTAGTTSKGRRRQRAAHRVVAHVGARIRVEPDRDEFACCTDKSQAAGAG